MKISVIIPYDKDRGFLKEAVASFDEQDYENKELIISQSDKRVGYNLNRGVERCTGELITYLCDDDMLMLPNALSLYVDNYTGWDFCHANSLNFSTESALIQRPSITHPNLKQLLHHNHIHGGTVCYHRRLFDEGLMFDESLWTAEEYDYNLMLLSLSKKLEYIDGVVYKYRVHGNQKSRILGMHYTKRQNYIKKIKGRYV